MALRSARFRPRGRPVWHMGGVRRTAWVTGPVFSIALAIAMAGCGPVETWRSLTGVNKNDPDPATALFTGNLAAGEAAPYPNLASVPAPPTRATTTEERQKLTQSLVADRNRAQADAGPPRFAPAQAATPLPAPPGAVAASAPARTALNSSQPGNSSQSGRRNAGEPPEPGPPDSNLQMPQVRSVPEPEAARPAPPAPALAAVPRPAAANAGAAPLPASVANMMPEPAPPVPVMDPVAPPPSSKPEPKRAPDSQRKTAATTVATLDIPASASGPASQDRAQIERVAALYRDNPGTVRVIGYAAGPAVGGGVGGGDPLASYHAALVHAQAVARALAEAGIPAGRIQTEAAPAAGARAAGRIAIQFMP